MKSLVNKNFNSFSFSVIVLQLIAFLLPLNHKFIPILIAIFALSVFIKFFKTKQKVKFNKSNLFLMMFYIFLGVGLFWTDNMKSGVFDLEVKMSLFIFPLLFSLINYDEIEVIKIIRALIFGVLIFFSISIYQAYQIYSVKLDGYHYFLYSRLSHTIHPSYMSMYIVVSMSFLLFLLRKGIYVFRNKQITLLIVSLLFLINFMVLSKIGIIVSVFLVMYFIISWVLLTKKYIAGFGFLLSIVLLFSVTYKKVDYVAQRVDEFVRVFNTDKAANSNKSSGIRLHIWEHAVALVKEKPILGYGTGDVKDELVKRYVDSNLESAIEHQYNAHNQYLQILISSGSIGLFIFLVSIFFGIKSNPLFFQFIIISLLFMSVESILENQAGTMFFGLFFCLFSQFSELNTRTD